MYVINHTTIMYTVCGMHVNTDRNKLALDFTKSLNIADFLLKFNEDFYRMHRRSKYTCVYCAESAQDLYLVEMLRL